MPRVSGIYEIRCILNDKKYIGSSSNISQRFWDHRTQLKRNVHHNQHLQHAWNKYGAEMFSFNIIEKCPRDILLEREYYWTVILGTLDSRKGYNLSVPGEIVEKEYKNEKVPSSRALRYIVSISSDGTQGGLLARDIVDRGVNYKYLGRVLRYWKNLGESVPHTKRSYKGVIYVYESDYIEELDYINFQKPPKSPKPRIKKEKIKNPPKPYSERNLLRISIQLENVETGNITIFSSIKEACECLGMNKQKIYKCLNSEYKKYKHKGFYIKRM